MKAKLVIAAGIIVTFFSSSTVVKAQAPSSIAGDGIFIEIASGTYPLASYGYSVFLPANSGNSCQIIGIYGVLNSSGTYSYSATSSTTGQAILNDPTDGITEQVSLTFNSAFQGNFFVSTISPPGYYQSGSFIGALGSAPASIAGKSIYCTVVDGLYPFANSGTFTFVTAASGNSYTLLGSGGVGNSSGTYSYTTVNRSTGKIQLTDSITGTSTAYIGFSDPSSGGYALTQPSTGGFQIANFVVLDTTPPTNKITAPTAGLQVSNADYTVIGTAGDNVAVSNVFYSLNNTGWSNAVTGNNWTNWMAVVTLLPGTNMIAAYAVDSSGNVSTTNTVSFVFVLSATLTVSTNGLGSLNQNYNGALLQIGKSFSITATAGSGFMFTNWTGGTNLPLSVLTNGTTVTFLMVSNLMLQANFVDVTKPTLTINSPTSGQRWSNATFNVSGTASDNWQVSNVQYQLNGSGWTNATGTTNWSAIVNLSPGTNSVQGYAVDTSGNKSTTKTVNFDFVVTNQLQVGATGLGTISPNYNNVWLEIGRNYSMTATAGTGFMFTNWTGGTGLPLAVLTNGTTVQFLMQSNLILQANFIDTSKPTLSITNLTSGQRVSNATFTVKGTTSDNWMVSNVWCQINGLGWNSATNINNWTNWAAGATLVPGTNVVQAYAVDTSGNVSTTSSVSFQFVVTNQLGVRALGLGTISPNYSNAWLEIGRNYNMAATPGSGFVFTNWVISTNWLGGTMTNNATVQFMMQSNLTLQVSFVDVTKPTLTIIAPTSGQHMANALATVVGTASDNWKVAGVWYSLNGGTWNQPATTNNWTNWTTTVELQNATNTLKAYALDLGGNFSTTNPVSFVSSNAFMLQLAFTTVQPLATNGLNFVLQVSTGLNGRIQVSTDLLDWVTLTNFVGTNATLDFLDPAATNFNNRFYRAVIP